MKSITEQGSSLEKAIKSAWERAQKPKEFAVKIFEEPTYNFLGINTHPAKIGLFFSLEQPVESTPVFKAFSIKKNQPPPYKAPVMSIEHAHESKKEYEPVVSREPLAEQSQSVKSQEKDIWHQEMITASETWLKEVLQHVEMSEHCFSLQALHYDLRITFDKPLFEQVERQQQLFRSLCLLLLQTLRQKFHRPLRGFRIIINSATHDSGQ